MRVAVLRGGRSSEHEISLASARSVEEALRARGHEVVSIEIARDGMWQLEAGAPEYALKAGTGPEGVPTSKELSPGGEVMPALRDVEVVLPILHGPFGEDGTVQGLLELANVPYVGAGHGASYLCMDKDVFKSVMRDKGIPVARSVTLYSGQPAKNPFGFPVFVKPASLGSSVGISKAHDEHELADAVALARRHDEKVLVEEFVRGVEVEVSVLGNREPPPVASLPGEIVVTNREWYDYAAKYAEGEMELIVPARVGDEKAARVQELAVQAFLAAGCEGMARADCFVRDDGEVLVNELNTIPGFTKTSVYAALFEASGIGYGELLERLLQLALERHERRRRLEF